MKYREKINGSESNKMANKKKKKNMKRLGGGGLSLEAFANAKSRTNFYNPALIKKQKEFYKNAKYVKKYKKLLKQQSQKHDSSDIRSLQDVNETEVGSSVSASDKNSKNRGISSLKVMYEKKHEEKEKARIEMEALDQARKEEKERVIAQRKAVSEKMFKKTRTGQPVMKYRIEHLLETSKFHQELSAKYLPRVLSIFCCCTFVLTWCWFFPFILKKRREKKSDLMKFFVIFGSLGWKFFFARFLSPSPVCFSLLKYTCFRTNGAINGKNYDFIEERSW